MDKQRWQRAEQLFYQAVELSAAQRDAFIRQACQQDAALAELVRRLLAHQGQTAQLQHMLAQSAAQLLQCQQDLSGSVLGPYRLLQLLGRGGMGTVYGAAIGSVLFLLAQSYLQDLLRLASESAAAWPLLSALLSPDRWLLWLGVLFVLSVYYFPTGVVGRLRTRAALKRSAQKSGLEESV